METNDGLVRLYRIEPRHKSDLPDWIVRGLAESGHSEAEGRWFVRDPEMLDWYREDIAGEARVVFVDVPPEDAEKYRVSNIQETIGLRPVKSFSKDPENEYFLPRAVAELKIEMPEKPGFDREFDEAERKRLQNEAERDQGISR